ncbi:MAG: RND transporter, partial [Gammaproteobacteria bacterium]
GNVVAIGVLAAFILTVTFLPALMSVLPARARKQGDIGSRVMARLGNWVVTHQKRLLWGSLLLAAILVAQVPRNSLNDNFVEYFDSTIKFRQDTDVVDKYLSGLYRINYSLDAKEPGGVSKPAFLASVQRFEEWLKTRPEVKHVNSITDIFRRLNKNMHGDDPAYYRLPESRELAAQYLLLYEMSLPYGLDLNNQINVDKSATRLSVSLPVMSTNKVLAFEETAREWMLKNTPDIHSYGSSPTIMFAHIGYRNIRSMLTGTSIALVLISMILIFAFRSFKLGLVSLIPNLVPAAVGFGIWGMTVGEVGLALSVVTGMTLGIVVDDTVHFMSKYLRARREQGLSAEDAIRYAFRSVGWALFVTSVVLVAGFLILTLSHFKLNSQMGLLTAVIIAIALIADFFLLPPLLMAVDKDQPKENT